jgi:hypothetical protein
MFTGIVEELGRVKDLTKEGDNLHISIEAHMSSELKIDQSVAHNGVCLTIVAVTDNTYSVTAIQETLNKSNLGSLKVNDLVNLERGMKLGARLDGHIVHTTLRFPEHNYLIGGVSISNNFSNFSKSLMIEFMKSHYYDPYFAQFVRPKKEFKVKLKDADKDFVFDASEADLNKFDKIIDEIEPGNNRLPVLLKKYIKQNARLLSFNVDPLFNNSVDGLMYIKIADLPESTVKPVLEEFQAEMEKKYAIYKAEENK